MGQGDVLGVWVWHMHTAVNGMIGQSGPAVWHRPSTQYSVIICMGKESEKKTEVYMYITESLCCIAEIITIF